MGRFRDAQISETGLKPTSVECGDIHVEKEEAEEEKEVMHWASITFRRTLVRP